MTVLTMVLGLLTCAAPASAVVYTTETSTGASIVPGATDIGNHEDDATTAISFPFPISFYGQSYTSGVVSSNGNLQLTGETPGDFANGCLPASYIGGAIMPYWDDLVTSNSGNGIFTSTTGVAPHRRFIIEWRAGYFSSSNTANFEIQLYEDSPIITVIYGITTEGISATAGVQAGGTGPATQFSCNTASLSDGLRVDYIPDAKTLTAVKNGTGAGAVESTDGRINCGTVCSRLFPGGSSVTLTASPDAGSRFLGWSGGGCSGTGDCVTKLDADETVTATFNLVHTLSVSKVGAGTGSVSSSPAGINCGAACSARFDQGTAVTLTASPAAGSRFAGWSAGGCPGTGSCVVTLGSDQNVTAFFEVAPGAPLDTKIDKARINQKKDSATFKFEAPGATGPTGFQCALLNRKHATPKFTACKSPKRYKHLKPHHYLFEVRALGAAGPDTTPAKESFTIK